MTPPPDVSHSVDVGVVDNKTPSLIGNDTVFTHNLHTTSFILQTTSLRFVIHISGIMCASPIAYIKSYIYSQAPQ